MVIEPNKPTLGLRVIALFELTLQGDEVKVVEERHYRLVPAKDLDQLAICKYKG